ncbi:hypothetical protein [Lysobacter sp. FW306-1B-D06B]|uniref:hypothetical protein n=1 Tax=Lysobacter sp. FW306-1B-D06B TaxID=3140250 RepID=UPI00313FFF79
MFKKIRSKVAKATAATSAMLVAGAASAGELATSFTGEVTDAKAELMLIGAALLVVSGVIVLIRRAKSAAN